MPNLSINSDNKLIYNATSKKLVTCGGVQYRQARQCPSVGALVDVWMTTTDAATFPNAFFIPSVGCYYFNFTDATSPTPGTTYVVADAEARADCAGCLPDLHCGLCPGSGLNSWTKVQVTFAGLNASICPCFYWTAAGKSYSFTGNMDVTVCCTNVYADLFCQWTGTLDTPVIIKEYSTTDCTGSFSTYHIDSVRIIIGDDGMGGRQLSIEFFSSDNGNIYAFRYDHPGISAGCSDGVYSNDFTVCGLTSGGVPVHASSGGTATLIWGGC